MENAPEPTTSEVSNAKEIDKTNDGPLVRFVGGFLLGLIAYAVVGASMEYTHTAIAEVGWLKLSMVGATPFVCGGLAVWFKDSFTDPLMNLVTSVGSLIG